VTALAVAGIFLVALTYFDEFLFFSPYLVFYIPQGTIGIFTLDTTLSTLSGIVVALSVYQLKNLPRNRTGQGKMGFAGIVMAIMAGACPCNYLVPLLAVAGGVGGALGALGIAFFTYQVPIKVVSLAMLGFVTFTLERSLRAYCEITPQEASAEMEERKENGINSGTEKLHPGVLEARSGLQV